MKYLLTLLVLLVFLQFLQAQTPGTIKWTFTTGNAITSSPAIGSDGTIYVGSWDYNLYAINPDSSLKWKFTPDSGEYFLEGVASTPVIGNDGTIFFSTGYEDEKLYALNIYGSEKWAIKTGSDAFASPAIGADGTIYLGSIDGILSAINPDSSRKWKFISGDLYYSLPAIGPDGTI